MLRSFAAGTGIALVLLACVEAPLEAASDRSCDRACRAEQRVCLNVARTNAKSFRAACAGGSSARRVCRSGTHAVLHSGSARCRRLRKDCRVCCRASGQGPTCPIGHPVSFDPPPPLDVAAAGLPKLADGNFFVLNVPDAQLEIDPARRDPLTGAGACARWLTTCVVTGGHPLDDCTRSAPPCATDRPWEEPIACCSASCFERYQDTRRAGTESLAALDAVYFGTDTCFPGVAALLAGGSQ